MEIKRKHIGYLVLGLGIIGLILANFSDLISTNDATAANFGETIYTTTDDLSISNMVIVEVKGEVAYPGIYQVNEELRVGDVILIAGGLTLNADTTTVNLAAKIRDEMIILIPQAETITTNVEAIDIVRIVVEIKGAVQNPGVYNLYKNSRVYDLIEASGGLMDNADTSGVDLARLLIDGESITIPEMVDNNTYQEEAREIYVSIIGEVISPGTYLVSEDYTVKDLIYLAGGVTINCDISKINWDVVLVLGAQIYIPSYDDEATVTQYSSKININTADLEALITLPGIGNIIGQRIIDYRSEYGDFLSIEDIMKVSGIKESIYEQIKDLITV